MRNRALVAGVMTLVTIALCACSSSGDTEPRTQTLSIQSTQFTPSPRPITDPLPTVEQLTELFDASKNYSIREEDRARLFDGPSEENRRIAREWGAQPSPQYVEFATAESVGTDEVHASGHGTFHGLGPYPVGPIPFVRWNSEWKVPRSYVCGVLGAFRPSAAGSFVDWCTGS